MSQTVTTPLLYSVPPQAREGHNPTPDLTFKITTYLLEAALRNGELDCFYTWLWIRNADLRWNGSSTGRVYGVQRLIEYLASAMKVCTRTARRYLKAADENGYVILDRLSDRVNIVSRSKLTLWLWRQDQPGGQVRGRSLPDEHMRHPRDILALHVSIGEVWSPGSKGLARSRALGVVRQRATEYGWSRETVGRLVGMERTSTTRLDRRHSVKRGWQFAFITVSDLTHHTLTKEQEDNFGRDLATAYASTRTINRGRGQKVWFGSTPDGEAAIFTQLPVKWDTPFAGRFREDKDVQRLFERTVSPSLLAGSSGLRSTRTITDSRISKPIVSTTTLSESMRESLWRLVQELTPSLDGVSVNPKPTIQLCDHVSWMRWTARLPNPVPPDPEKNITKKTKIL